MNNPAKLTRLHNPPGPSEQSDMARNDQVTRILKVIHYLEVNPRGLSLRQLINKLEGDGIEVSDRTLRRDLEAIESVHFPLKKDESLEEVRWHLDSIASINQKIQFSYEEMIALFLARESLTTFRSSPLFGPINNLFDRLEKILGIGAQKELENLKGYLEYKPTATWQTGVSQEVLDTIYSGCAEGYVLNVSYKSKSGQNKDQVKTRRLGPEGLYFADSGVYLIAKDLDQNEHRSYSVARIVEAVRTDVEYNSNEFSIKDYIKGTFGTLRTGDLDDVEIFIADPIAAYVSERRWHESQQVTRVEGGINLKLNVRNNDELVRWILGLGPTAKVLKPKALADSVMASAERILKEYAPKKAA